MKKLKKWWKRYRLFLQKLRFQCMRDGEVRAGYLRKHEILAEIGTNVYYYSRIMPADPKLVKIHNNVSIATNVRFVNHDRIDIVLSGIFNKKYGKQYGCIEVMDNVFIGADTVILPGVRIGPNAIVGAGSIVTKDIPANVVAVGNPCKVLREIGEKDEKYYYRDREIDVRAEEEGLIWEK